MKNLGKWLEEAVEAREDMDDDKVIAEDAVKSAARAAAVVGPSVIHNPPKPWAR